MRRRWEARPLAVAATGRATVSGRAVTSSPRPDCSTAEPVVLSVPKRGRLCLVAKLVPLDGQPVLAIVHRGQRGVQTTISVPTVALEYAERAGCRWLVFRRDTTGEMWRLSLADLRRVGWLKTSCGLAEWFVRIAEMAPVAWRAWAYAKRVVRLDALPAQRVEPDQPQQLAMFGGGG